MNKRNFQYHLSHFLTKEMTGNRNNSSNTISSYATTFKMFLEYLKTEKGINPNRVNLEDLTKDNITSFLNWLEDTKGNQVSSRNIRLATIRSFVKYLQIEDVENIYEYQKILSIKNKKTSTNEVMWLTREQMLLIMSIPNSSTKDGLKDKVLLATLYDTGARVDELIHLKLIDLYLGVPSSVKLNGKGRKIRIVPIMGSTVTLLKNYIKENELEKRQYTDHEYLFQNRSGQPYTRAGISYIINKYVKLANSEKKANITIKVYPHVFRHSKAVHLLEAGVELIYIRDILGHSSIKTTEIYARVCTQNKVKALEKVYENITQVTKDDWTQNKDLMEWLSKLSK